MGKDKHADIGRFHGFWLGNNDRDRAILGWLIVEREKGTNLAEVVKGLLHAYITGADRQAAIVDELRELRHLIESGVSIRSDNNLTVDEDQQLLENLKGMGT